MCSNLHNGTLNMDSVIVNMVSNYIAYLKLRPALVKVPYFNVKSCLIKIKIQTIQMNFASNFPTIDYVVVIYLKVYFPYPSLSFG